MHKRSLLWLFIIISAACLFQAFAQDEDEDLIADDGGVEEDAAVYLLKEQHIKVEKSGLKTIREHNVLKILKRSAIEYAGDIGFEYNSYYSKAKLVKAFTLTPEGRKIEVSKDAVHDTMPQNFQEFKMYSDVRTLHFSMPAVEVGSVLDYEIEVTETKPVMEGQAWDSRYLDDSLVIEDSRYTLEYPSKMKLLINSMNITNSPTTNHSSNVTTLSWAIKNTPKLKYETGMPPVNDTRQSVHFTSLSSWNTVRDWFAKLASEKVKTSDDIQKLVANLTSNAPSATDKIRALSLMMQKDVRYVGVELGRSAYEPHHAVDCLRNKYGDCKDKSILLVSMLKQAGITAYPALVRPSYFGDLVMDVPHPGQFNHVIVYIPDHGLWLDPTAKYYDIDVYPAPLDGCQALVVGAGIANFVRIPSLAPERDITRVRYEIDMHHNGRSVVKEISEAVGRAGADERMAYEELNKEKRQEQLEKAFERKDGRERLISLGNTDPHDLAKPFESWVTYETDLFFEQANMGFGFSISAQAIEDPLYLGHSDDSDAKGKSKERQYEWMARSGSSREISCAIRLPPGFAPDELPARQKYALPHGQIGIGCTLSNDILTASCTVSRKSCVIPADKWKKARNDTASSLSKASITITLVDDIEKLLTRDSPTDAINKITGWQKDSPGNGEFHHRLARVYHRCGLLVSARKEYLKAIDLGYKDLDVYSDLTETYGGFGGVYGYGLKRDDVVRVLKTAIETSNDKLGARYMLATSYLRDSKGAMYGKKAPYKNAIAIYETLAAEKPEDTRPILAMGRCYFAAGDYEKSESCFEKAFELDKLSPDAKSGKWTCAAFLGRVDETVNAVRNGVGESSAQAAELQRIAVKLMFSRKYTEAAALLTKANALSPDKQSQRDLPKLLSKMAKQDLPDYETYFDLSTPKKAVVSMIAGMFLEDTGKIEKSCSERMKINRDELEGASVALRATLGESSSNLTDLSLDLLANVWTASERQLDDNHLELSLSPPKEQALGTRKGTKITCILRKENNGEWRICAMGYGTFFAAALGTVASWCIEHNDMDGAKFYVDQIASHIASVPASSTIEGKSSVRDMLDELDREEFTNKIARTLAYTGVSIAEVGKYLESADYLRKSAALEPENVTVRRMLGEVLISGALYEEAEKAFGMVVARKPNDWRAMQQQITALAQSQKNDAAMALLPKLKEIAPSVQQVAMTEVLVYQEAGKFEAAMKAFQKAKSQLHPVAAFGMEANLLGYMQRKDDLARLAEEDQDTEPNLKPLMNRAMAAAYMLTSDPVRTAEQLECLLMKNMEDVSSMMRLAFLMIDKGDYEEAASMAERAASAPLLLGEARLDIGDVCLALGRYDEAESLFDKAREGTKADRGVYRELMLGAYRLIQGRKADAVRCFKNASAAPLGSVWPAPICKFYAGEATLDDLLTIARAQTNPLRRDQFLCETYFYVSMKAIGDGDKQKATELLTRAIETKSYVTSEFMLARAQLRLLQAGK